MGRNPHFMHCIKWGVRAVFKAKKSSRWVGPEGRVSEIP
ncbi:hypothetical protein CLOBOL_05243 [Enterocloster bolteae ATCC BAA-613]|uniref:Uncharacterized protein n=1 Tax=Enterocloster bolteae (strain ATCC BAA-613 / DSM 15670 / CCUG 46953 / JCM 12243 / WAL 16351) TaxID=411902 RepID=A8RYW0_ENTBW|nr:hypothetical protein CLOBOL_05243 [Enterocloster bolteae ATCC BAA-613]